MAAYLRFILLTEKCRLLFTRTAYFRLTPRPVMAGVFAALNPNRFRRFLNRHRLTPRWNYTDSIARIGLEFSPENIDFLMKLRMMGHVYVGDAARVFGLPNAEAFVQHTMDIGVNNYLRFMPLFDGRAGVLVEFDRLLIDLRPV